MVLEFSGTQYSYTDAASNYRASGTFTAYPNVYPKYMVQKMTKASSDSDISITSPWISYSIYEIIDDELTLGYGEVQGDSNGLPNDFAGAYAMERFQRVDRGTDIRGNSKNQNLPD